MARRAAIGGDVARHETERAAALADEALLLVESALGYGLVGARRGLQEPGVQCWETVLLLSTNALLI